MDEFEKIRAFSAELGKKTEEAVAAENAALEGNLQPEPISETTETETVSEQADFLENWNTPTENTEEVRHLSKTFWAVLICVSLLLGCLIVVVYLLLKGPIEKEEIVTIAPTPTPVKVRPENPGGMLIPDQDKVIYSRITQDTIPTKVEKLFPEEEKPVMPPVVEEPAEIPVFEEIEAEEVKVILAETLPAAAAPEKKEEVKVLEKIEPQKEVTLKVEPKKDEWKVQLFSSTDKAKVEKQWQVISKKHKALVSDIPMQIVPAEIAGKGTFYRLQVGAFETRQMANNLCAKLKKQKQECYSTK